MQNNYHHSMLLDIALISYLLSCYWWFREPIKSEQCTFHHKSMVDEESLRQGQLVGAGD